jgi:hypothetical protein
MAKTLGSFIPYNMPVYPGALRVADSPNGMSCYDCDEASRPVIESSMKHERMICVSKR